MALRDTMHRTLVYFGLAEDRDAYEEEEVDPREPERDLEERYRERPNVRRLSTRRRRDEIDDIFADDSASRVAHRAAALRSPRRPAPTAAAARAPASTSWSPSPSTTPRTSRTSSRTQIPVIVNLQGIDRDLSKRLVDFASGLTYALDGGMQQIADKVFLLTPRNVEVSAEERARLIEKGFFNQSG